MTRRKKKAESWPPLPPRSEATVLKKFFHRGDVVYIDYYPEHRDESSRYGYCAFVDPPLETAGINTGPQFGSAEEAERQARRDILMSQIRYEEGD